MIAVILLVLIVFVMVFLYMWWRDPYRKVEKRVREMSGQRAEGEKESWVQTTEAAKEAGVSRKTVWRWAKAGLVRSKRKGRVYLVSLEDVLKYAEKRKK